MAKGPENSEGGGKKGGKEKEQKVDPAVERANFLKDEIRAMHEAGATDYEIGYGLANPDLSELHLPNNETERGHWSEDNDPKEAEKARRILAGISEKEVLDALKSVEQAAREDKAQKIGNKALEDVAGSTSDGEKRDILDQAKERQKDIQDDRYDFDWYLTEVHEGFQAGKVQAARAETYGKDESQDEEKAYAQNSLQEIASRLEKRGGNRAHVAELRNRADRIGEEAGDKYAVAKAEREAKAQQLQAEQDAATLKVQAEAKAKVETDITSLEAIGDAIHKNESARIPLKTEEGREAAITALGMYREPFYTQETGGFRGGRILEMYYRTSADKDTIILIRKNIKTGQVVSQNILREPDAIERTRSRGKPTDAEGPTKALRKSVKEVRSADKESPDRGRTGVKEYFDTSAGTSLLYSSVTQDRGNFHALPKRVQQRKKHRSGWLSRLFK